MKIILREDVQNIGARGEIVTVKDGFARNYLIPKGLAAKITPGNVKQIEQERRLIDVRLAKEEHEAQRLAQRISEISCTIVKKVSESDVLYGSVTQNDIVDALREEGILIEKRKVRIDDPIKKLGIYKIPVRLHPEVSAELTVWVVKE
ncbi:50S ribosomal protein L9 [Acidobacteriota bacterium]